MPDNESSGSPAAGTSGSSVPPTSSAPTDSPTAPANGAFGATRGSGLARGKRPATSSVSAAAPAPVGYQPTALEVIKPQSEYKNPFTGETSTPAPVVNEPAPQAAPAPAPAPVPAAAPVQVTAAASTPATVAADSKAELNILPPEPARRPAVSWESPAPAPRSDDRPTFQPRERREGERRDGGQRRDGGERREGRERREGGERREGRDGRSYDQRPRREPRDDRRGEPRPQSAPAAPASEEKKAGGFFGWLKGLFGGKKKAPEGRTERPHGNGGHRHDQRGPRPEGSEEDGDGQRRRRRRRGGRGRNRGEGGDRGPRPEGQQGGGAI